MQNLQELMLIHLVVLQGKAAIQRLIDLVYNT